MSHHRLPALTQPHKTGRVGCSFDKNYCCGLCTPWCVVHQTFVVVDLYASQQHVRLLPRINWISMVCRRSSVCCCRPVCESKTCTTAAAKGLGLHVANGSKNQVPHTSAPVQDSPRRSGCLPSNQKCPPGRLRAPGIIRWAVVVLILFRSWRVI